MTKKFYSIATSCAFAMAFGLAACSDDSSSGTNANIDTGDEINIPISDKVSSAADKGVSSSSKIDSIKVTKNDPDESDAESSSSTAKNSPESSAEAKSSSSEASAKEDTGFINEGWREDCLAKINEYRATEDLKPLTLASEEKQTCADKQSADDLKTNEAHGHFGDCGEFAQNSGPNFSGNFQKNASAVAEYYLKMMWEDEKAKAEKGVTEYAQIGHYLNMKNTSYTKVACGITLSEDGKKGWFNVDFF
ncbi:MAG: CAP domain-containing protein [Fibrobacter sp.]|nr:CAP domain-containing protein [Fibrobacter sp.]